MQATQLADELTDSRAELISAREEERQRLRRDLHDGLGPALTGVMLKAAAARRLISTMPADAAIAAQIPSASKNQIAQTR